MFFLGYEMYDFDVFLWLNILNKEECCIYYKGYLCIELDGVYIFLQGFDGYI